MATYLDIQNRVLTRLIDTPTKVAAEVPALVNTALRILQDMRDWKCMETWADVVTSVAAVNHLLVARPADWKVANGKPYYTYDANSRSRNIEWRTDRRYVYDTWGTRCGHPQDMVDIIDKSQTDGTSNFYLWPNPDGASTYTDGEYRISIPYYRYLAPFAQSTDTNWFSLNCDNFLVYQATALGFLIDWDESNAAVWEGLAQREYAMKSKQDKLREMSNVQTLEIRTSGAKRD